ncbi:HD domain-containing protein [Candidatus Peregrinibacteria bacterium]|nr:HD domain-containing protein [Candidatus Peregrinibacteria bacterium]
MRVTRDSQANPPADFEDRVLNVTGTLVGRHPDLEEFLDAGVREAVMVVAEQVRRDIGSNGSLTHLRGKGLPTMLAGAIAGDYSALTAHMVGASKFAERLARSMKLTDSEVEKIRKGALIHDIGKVDPSIRKLVDFPGRLVQGGKDIVAWHPEMGARIAQCLSADPETVAMVRGHHKRFDGDGYVAQRAPGIEIPAAVVQLADALDAMVKGRPGKESMSAREIVTSVFKSNGTHFHPDVVKAFMSDPGKILGNR